MPDNAPFDPQSRFGPLAGLNGARPPAPGWFADATALKPQSRFVTVEGVPIHYLGWGDPALPGILLVHGNAAHAHWWSFIAPMLARDYHVAAMDLSGMGDSGWRPPHGAAGGYALELFAREQMAVCADAGLFDGDTPPVIIGHSFGGFVTLTTGAMQGARLGGIVILDSPIHPSSVVDGGDPVFHMPRAHLIYSSLAEALARFRLMPPQETPNLFLLDWVARHSLKTATRADGGRGLTWKFDPAVWRHFSVDAASLLRAADCRVAVFRGEYSALMPPASGNYVREVLGKTAPVIEIPAAGHHLMLDQPLALVAALKTLLADWEH